jgi:hypothetical protein
MGDQPVAMPLPIDGNTNTKQHRHPFLQWDSNYHSHCLRGRRHFVSIKYKYGDLALQVGGVSNETVKYGREFCGTSTPRVTAQKQLYSKLQTRPLVREGATKEQTRSCLKEISSRKKIWSRVPDGRLTPRQTDRLTFGLKFNFNFNFN